MKWNRFFRRASWDQERARELEAHLQIETDNNVARGLPPEEARYAAQRKLGNPLLVREEIYQMNSIGFAETLAQDLRYAVRMLKRSPGFAALAALSLAIGLGGNAAMFSVLSSALIRPLPYAEPERLVRVTGYYPEGALAALEERSRTMDIAGFRPDLRFNLTGAGEALRLAGSSVSANFFFVLQAGPELGRVFRSGEDRPGQDRVLLLSHALWQSKFGGDPHIVGRVVVLDGISRQVVGVMPPGFGFPSSQVQVWIPLHLDPRQPFDTWNSGFMPVVARLRPAATLAQARGEIRPLVAGTIPLFPYAMPRTWNADATVVPLQQDLTGGFRGKLLVLQCAAGLVLLIACANIAGLLLSRACARQKEVALRAALGAGRWRIVRQLLTESVVLALAGAALGLVLAYAALPEFERLVPRDALGVPPAHLDARVAALMAVVAILTGVAFGLAPALSASRMDLASSIKTGGRRSTGATSTRVRSVLIAGEVALAAVLAVSAGLLVKTLWKLAQVNPGFAPQHILTARISPDPSLCLKPEACAAFYGELLLRARSLGGVSEAAAIDAVPMGADVPAIPAELEGHRIVPGQSLAPMLWAGAVTPEYFRLMHIPLLEGREFSAGDSARSAGVVVVSAATARRYWPGEDAVGKHLRTTWEQGWRTVVGVVGDVRQYDLANHSPTWLSGAVYMPYAQSVGLDGKLPVSLSLLVRTDAGAAEAAGRLRELVRDINPNVPVSEVRPLQDVVTDSAAEPRSVTRLFLCFAGVALLLAAVGTYGVVSYSTSQRTFEIGMRMALGARRRDVFGMVLGQGLKLVLAGLAVGVAAALALTRLLAAFLYGVTATDPVTFLAVAALLTVIALLAGYIPARKAAGVDPLAALRVD